MTNEELNRLADLVVEKTMKKQNALTWSLKEAAEYAGIGYNRFTKIANGYDWVLWVSDSIRRVKPEPFKKWLYAQEYIA